MGCWTEHSCRCAGTVSQRDKEEDEPGPGCDTLYSLQKDLCAKVGIAVNAVVCAIAPTWLI